MKILKYIIKKPFNLSFNNLIRIIIFSEDNYSFLKLHKYDKKIKQRTEGQENETVKNDNDVQIDEVKATAPVIRKCYCVFCKVEFKAAANHHQHKSTNSHKENE
jgi:hypothetical protein